MYAAVLIDIYIQKTKLTENGNANFHLVSANRKQKFVFLGWQTINGN
jgi:hypothetical protein